MLGKMAWSTHLFFFFYEHKHGKRFCHKKISLKFLTQFVCSPPQQIKLPLYFIFCFSEDMNMYSFSWNEFFFLFVKSHTGWTTCGDTEFICLCVTFKFRDGKFKGSEIVFHKNKNKNKLHIFILERFMTMTYIKLTASDFSTSTIYWSPISIHINIRIIY